MMDGLTTSALAEIRATVEHLVTEVEPLHDLRERVAVLESLVAGKEKVQAVGIQGRWALYAALSASLLALAGAIVVAVLERL